MTEDFSFTLCGYYTSPTGEIFQIFFIRLTKEEEVFIFHKHSPVSNQWLNMGTLNFETHPIPQGLLTSSGSFPSVT